MYRRPWPVPAAYAVRTRSAKRCVAPVGKLGKRVRCGLYEFLPDPYREFAAPDVHGSENEACNQALLRHGLPQLPDGLQSLLT